MHPQPGQNWVDHIEETLIALLLGLMTLVTFANVVARYGFNSNILFLYREKLNKCLTNNVV